MAYVFTPEEELILDQLAIHEDMRPWLSSLDVKYKFGQTEIRGIETIFRSLAAAIPDGGGGGSQTFEEMFPPIAGAMIFARDEGSGLAWQQLLLPPDDNDYFVHSTLAGPEWATVPVPSFQDIFPATTKGDIPVVFHPFGSPYWDVVSIGAAVEGDVFTVDADGMPSWATPAGGGGGYDKLTATGVNGGTFTFQDDTAVTGTTQVHIRPGAAQGFDTLFATYPIGGDSPGIYSYGGSMTTYFGGGVNDYNERYFALGYTFMLLPSDGKFAFSSSPDIYNAEVRFIRSAANTIRVADSLGDPAGFDVGTLYLDDGSALFQVQIDAAIGGKRFLYIDE